MRMLAIDCATEACSIALFDGGSLMAARHEVLGRGHAEHLIPLIAALPDRGRAGEIRVSLGPGSFTGVRIGLAAAQALGFAWGASVRGFPSLALVAATARAQHSGQMSVCMAGGHGEWFVQDFDAAGLPMGPALSIAPNDAAQWPAQHVIVGNRAAERAAQSPGEHDVVTMLPDARFLPALPESLLSDDLSPHYGRAPDARLPS